MMKPSRYSQNVRSRNTPNTAYAWLGGKKVTYSGKTIEMTNASTDDRIAPGRTSRHP